jgi:hypothetical protein
MYINFATSLPSHSEQSDAQIWYFFCFPTDLYAKVSQNSGRRLVVCKLYNKNQEDVHNDQTYPVREWTTYRHAW